MSQPPFPSLLTSFTAFQQSQGNNSFPGTQVDAQFNQINSILTAVIGNLSLIQRADNKLASGSVGLDQVGPDVLGYIVAAAASGGAPPSNVSPSLVPSGAMILWPLANVNIPSGFIIANGVAVSRQTRASLFAAQTFLGAGTTTTASNQVTNFGSPNFANVANGMFVEGLGIPAGTTVVLGAGTTVLTLSNNVTLGYSNQALRFSQCGLGDNLSTFILPNPAPFQAFNG